MLTFHILVTLLLTCDLILYPLLGRYDGLTAALPRVLLPGLGQQVVQQCPCHTCDTIHHICCNLQREGREGEEGEGEERGGGREGEEGKEKRGGGMKEEGGGERKDGSDMCVCVCVCVCVCDGSILETTLHFKPYSLTYSRALQHVYPNNSHNHTHNHTHYNIPRNGRRLLQH